MTECYIEYQFWGRGRGPRKATLVISLTSLKEILDEAQDDESVHAESLAEDVLSLVHAWASESEATDTAALAEMEDL